jgi:uncharacterized protein (TIGR02246 family)
MRILSTVTAAAAVALLLASAPSVARDPTAQERSDIENLAYRYIFALDWRDAAAYANTFAPDGVLNYGGGQAVGRDAIRKVVETMRERAQSRPAGPNDASMPGQHFVTSMVIDVAEDGNSAISHAYWTLVGGKEPRISAYGHYADELVKIDGKWLYASRRTYNQQAEGRGTIPYVNPVTNPGRYGVGSSKP